ncbi:MAG: hypothetical protein Q7J32_08480 [Sphingomonadaceae bacterium]|nr:hypothetical protein [Sphingomonadaceae bacterium]
MIDRRRLGLAACLLLATPLLAQCSPAMQDGANRASDIATQPVRDVGLDKDEIPAPLVAAVAKPYSLAGLKRCSQLGASIANLSAILGPDFGTAPAAEENRAGKIAEAGGKAVVNSIIPFRGLVREFTGAAPAQRRMNVAIDAGYARRGFLRGVYTQRGCKPAL